MQQAIKGFKELKGERNYLLYLLSCVFSRIGDSIDSIAYSWMAYELTGSAVWLTIIIGVNALPTIFLTPLVAPLVEHMNKQLIMVLTNIFRAVVVALTGIAMVMGILTAPMLLVATLIISISESFSDPAYMACIPQIISKDKLDEGISLRSVVSQTSQLVGTGLAGVIIGVWGAGGALIVDGVLFALTGIVLSFMRIKKAQIAEGETAPKKKDSYLASLKSGCAYFFKRPSLVLLCLSGVALNFLLSPMNQLETAYVVDTLKLDAYALSVSGVAGSIGMLLGSVCYPFLKNRLTMKRALILCGVVTAVKYSAMVLLGLFSAAVWMKYGTMFVLGLIIPLCVSIFSLMGNVLFFKVIDDGYLSRMASIFNALSLAAVPIGSSYSGALVSLMPIVGVYAFSAIVTLLATLICSRLKALRELDTLSKLEPKGVEQLEPAI